MKKRVFILMLSFSLVTLQAQEYRVEHLGRGVNTTGSESGAVLMDDSTLLYASTQTNSDTKGRLYLVDFSAIYSQIMQAHRNADGTFVPAGANRWGLNRKGYNCANIAYDVHHDAIYFTVQEMGKNSTPQLYCSRRVAGKWSKPAPLGGDVNLKGYTSTHPAVAYTPDGKTILYYSSDRPGGVGGLDIWYVILLGNGKPGHSTNLGMPVNTDSNEVTPFYSTEEGKLYFSSNRTGGHGGYDIYCSEGHRNTWQTPRNVGVPLNSAYNDLFFSVLPCRCQCRPVDGERGPGTLSGDELAAAGKIVEACGYLTSNRPGSLFETDSNCCNDIFAWSRIHKPSSKKPEPAAPKAHSPLDLLPLSLYFHNDQPDPATQDTVTSLSYAACWRKYVQLRDEYKGAQISPADKRKWDSVQQAVDFFFDYEVNRGYHNLLKLCELLNHELRGGKKVVLMVDGYASPLHNSEYNVNLSKRRIYSIYNLMKEWNDQTLLPYLNNGHLVLETVAHGAPDIDVVAPSDPLRDPKSARSVYSIEAALDRRVDIVDIKIGD